MTDEALSPPTDADRATRDVEYVRRAQISYKDGFRVRQSIAPPEREIQGTKKKSTDPKESLAHMAEERCPKDLPGHEAERWRAGFLDADRIGTTKGHGYLKRLNIDLPRLVKKPPAAEPLEMFPEAVLATKTPLRMNERGLLSPGGMAPAKKYGTPDDQP